MDHAMADLFFVVEGWRGRKAVSVGRPERGVRGVQQLVCDNPRGVPHGHPGGDVLFSGMELAMASRDMASKEESFMILVYASMLLTGSNAVLGFIAGVVLHLLLHLREV
ncbi:hypothetical protein ZWY2020_049158 [Hordeum vulgare]|nr:hypothetical protein ZWY2020_049158 [Hordeum vulgare]